MKVPVSATAPSFDDTFTVSMKDIRRASRDEYKEWMRRRDAATDAKVAATKQRDAEQVQAMQEQITQQQDAAAEQQATATKLREAKHEARAQTLDAKRTVLEQRLQSRPAAAPRTDCALEEYRLKGDTLRKGFLQSWPVAGATAEFTHGADVGKELTWTRVALVGVFALAVKKNKNKVYVAVELVNGEQLLVEAPAKKERAAREFASKVNQASTHYAGAP